jgi:hypothetical protein
MQADRLLDHAPRERIRLLVTQDGDDCLKAALSTVPGHPRALHTLLEGIALWYGEPLTAVIIADAHWGSSLVDGLFGGGLWPHDLANVRFDICYPQKAQSDPGTG